MKQNLKKLLTNPWYFWALVICVYIIARVATWGYPFDSDHWIFYYVGHNWFHGGSLYVTAWDHKPPMIFLINGIMSVIFGSNIILHRIFFTLLSLVDIFLFYKLLKIVIPKLKVKATDIAIKVGLLLYVAWRNFSQFTSSANNNENFGLIFFIGMLLSYLSFREDRKWWKLLISGSCLAVLFFFKGNFLLLGAPIGLFILFDYFKDFKRLVGYALAFGMPLVMLAAAWSAYFLQKGTFGDFIVASLSFSAKYASSAWKGDLSNLKTFYILVAMASPLLIIGPLLFLYKLYANRKNETYILLAGTVLLGSFAFFGVGVPYLYYFLILMPVYILIATYLLFSCDKLPKLLYLGFVVIFVGALAVNAGFSMLQIKNTLTGRVKTEAEEYKQIAEYVHTNTTANDKVFAYDYGATFYQLSGRDSGSRFVSASVLLLDYRGHYGFDLDKIFIQDMEKSQTKYVVVYRDKDNIYSQNKPVVDYFDTHYVLDKTFTKFEVLKRK